MGYTHYFRQKEELDAVKWSKFTKDVNKLLKLTPICSLKEESDSPNPPIVNNKVVRFNGLANNGHETFLIDRKYELAYSNEQPDEDGYWFNFCKTARKPYDIYVVAVLELAKKHFGDDIKLGSDGNDEELADGKELAGKI